MLVLLDCLVRGPIRYDSSKFSLSELGHVLGQITWIYYWDDFCSDRRTWAGTFGHIRTRRWTRRSRSGKREYPTYVRCGHPWTRTRDDTCFPRLDLVDNKARNCFQSPRFYSEMNSLLMACTGRGRGRHQQPEEPVNIRKSPVLHRSQNQKKNCEHFSLIIVETGVWRKSSPHKAWRNTHRCPCVLRTEARGRHSTQTGTQASPAAAESEARLLVVDNSNPTL